MNELNSVLIIAVVAIVTAAIRFSPFIIFKNRIPKIVEYLSNVLPFAVIGMLVIYCMKDTNFRTLDSFVPQIAAGLLTAVVHKIMSNTLLSILAGTICYMVLVRVL